MALRIDASVTMSAVLIPRSARAIAAAGTAPGHVEPDRLAGRGQGRMRQRKPQGLAHDLGAGRGAEEMAAAAGRGARAAAQNLGIGPG